MNEKATSQTSTGREVTTRRITRSAVARRSAGGEGAGNGSGTRSNRHQQQHQQQQHEANVPASSSAAANATPPLPSNVNQGGGGGVGHHHLPSSVGTSSSSADAIVPPSSSATSLLMLQAQCLELAIASLPFPHTTLTAEERERLKRLIHVLEGVAYGGSRDEEGGMMLERVQEGEEGGETINRKKRRRGAATDVEGQGDGKVAASATSPLPGQQQKEEEEGMEEEEQKGGGGGSSTGTISNSCRGSSRKRPASSSISLGSASASSLSSATAGEGDGGSLTTTPLPMSGSSSNNEVESLTSTTTAPIAGNERVVVPRLAFGSSSTTTVVATTTTCTANGGRSGGSRGGRGGEEGVTAAGSHHHHHCLSLSPSPSGSSGTNASCSCSGTLAAGRGEGRRGLRGDGVTALPEPIWQHVYSFVPAQDLFAVMLTSRQCKTLSLPFKPFYQHWNLRAAETTQAARQYIETQRHLNAKMRAILLDWITDVHQSLNFHPATLYRTAHILDQFLIKTENVTREKLQLVGVTAFMVAAKTIETTPPDPDDCAYWTDNAYSGAEVSAMETRVLKVWRSDVMQPTAQEFLILYLKKAGLGKLTCCRAQYYAERVIQEHAMLAYAPSMITAAALLLALKAGLPTYEHSMLAYTPSMIAAAAVLLALKAGIPSGPAWPVELQSYSGYKEDELIACAAQMCHHIRETVTTLSGRRLDAVKRKYGTGHYLAVSKMDPPVADEQ